jgi:hypothetical protein
MLGFLDDLDLEEEEKKKRNFKVESNILIMKL